MADKSMSVDVVGLRDFQRALKGADGDFAPRLKAVHKEIGIRVIQAANFHAASRPSRGGGGSVAFKAAGSLRASTSVSYASVRGGGSKAPYFYGAEFGSKRYTQFEQWKGNRFTGWTGKSAGYFLMPAVDQMREQTFNYYLEALQDISRDAFPE